MSNDLRKFYLNEMGIETWVRRNSNLNFEKLVKLKKLFANCDPCLLNLLRRESALLNSKLNHELMIILDEPLDNDPKYEILLAKMLRSIGFTIDNLYITDIFKCSVSDNKQTLNKCQNLLTKEISIISPKVILALGQLAGRVILNTDLPISKMRGNIYDYQGIKVVASFTPQYLLYNQVDKKTTYNDLLLIKSLLSS